MLSASILLFHYVHYSDTPASSLSIVAKFSISCPALSRCVTTISLSTRVAHNHVALRKLRDIRFVGDHNDRNSAIIQFLKNSHDFDARPAIEIAGRLIRENHFRLVDERAGNRHALLLTARKLARIMIFAACQPDRRKNQIGLFTSCALVRRATIKRQLDIFSRGRSRQKIEILEYKPDFPVTDIGQLISTQRGNIGLSRT